MVTSNLNEIDNIVEAAKIIKSGKLLAFPTETVYGLGANAYDQNACLSIFRLKTRPQNNPLIVHVNSLEQASEFVYLTEDALRLSKFLPAPLTLVLKKRGSSKIAQAVTANLDTIAIRIPNHPVARALLAEVGGPIVAPSANISGNLSPTTKEHVKRNFPNLPILIGSQEHRILCGIESTILDLSTNIPTILRHGFITREDIENFLKKPVAVARSIMNANHLGDDSEQEQGVEKNPESEKDLEAEKDLEVEKSLEKDLEPKAPGMMYRHYAPKTKIRINGQSLAGDEIGLNFANSNLMNKKVPFIINLSISGDLEEAARNLFLHLHILDQYAEKNKLQAIVVAPIPNTGIGIAINDKLIKAAQAHQK